MTAEERRRRQAESRARNREAGLCPACGRVPSPGYKMCDVCREVSRRYYSKPDVKAARQRPDSPNKRAFRRHVDKNRVQIRNKYAKRRLATKIRVVEHYGGRCSCCGEDGLQFLAVDHINGDGHEQRKRVPHRSHTLYEWIIKNNFPADLQILCHSCNVAKGTGKACPHQLGTVIRIRGPHPDQLNLFD